MKKNLALIIEDDEQLSQIFSITLSEMFQIEAITDGAKALERLAQVTPQLVILDINLPNVNGVEILRHIRADPRLRDTRVIVATANPLQSKDTEEAADIVLLKPVSINQLRDLAERLK